MDERIKKLANNLVNYSMAVKPGDKVYVHHIGESTEDLARQVVKEIYKAGGLPFVHYTNPRLLREVLCCTEEQMSLMAKVDASEMDKWIVIR